MKRIMSAVMAIHSATSRKLIIRMISTSTNAPEHPEQAAAPPALPGDAHQGVASSLEMSGGEMLGLIFQTCDEMGVSDVQMRSGLPVYIETNLGMECLPQLGTLSSDDVYKIYCELLTNRESASHGFGEEGDVDDRSERKIDEAITGFKEAAVDDFSCNGILIPATGKTSGRLRIQVHLSANGLGITCRILNDSIPELDVLGIDS